MTANSDFSPDAILSRIAESLPNYRQRDEQGRMVAEIQAQLSVARVAGEPVSGENIVVINAPTGSGKTLAYLIGAAPVAMKQGKKLVIATATVSLQEQLLHKDLPFLVEHGGLNIRYALAKGRGRYVCPVRLQPYVTRKPISDDFTGAQELDALIKLAHALGNGWNGERDTWPNAIPDTAWRRVTNDRYGCTGRTCDHFDSCPYFRAREGLKQVDIIVANHDLVLADLALGGGYILPNPADTIYVFDEAHHLPDKCIRTFASDMRLHATARRLEKLPNLLKRVAHALRDVEASSHVQHCQQQTQVIAANCDDLVQALANYGPLQGFAKTTAPMALPIWQFNGSRLPNIVETTGTNIRNATTECLTYLNLLRRRLQIGAEQQALVTATAEALIAELGAYIPRLLRVRDTFELMLTVPTHRQAPIARWIEAFEYDTGVDYEVSACRVSAADILRERLWERAAGVVITSATLTVQHQFKHFMKKAGLGPMTDTRYVLLKMPFDYEKNAEFRIPYMLHDPKNPAAHTAEVVSLLPQIVDLDEGTLVLFTSKTNMEEVYGRLAAPWKQRVLRQGSASREELLRIHAERLKRGEGNILFGLNEFSEGLNLPGRLCTHVVIAKLPFSAHEDPVYSTLCRWIEENDGNPFMEVAVPEAALRLVQAAGRLLRHETDSGVVSLLDRRIVTKPYGKILLRSLPPFRVVIEPANQKQVA